MVWQARKIVSICRKINALIFSLALGFLCVPPAVARDVDVRMWTFLNPTGTSGREKALAEIIRQFEAANPGVKVQVEQQVWDQMGEKFLAAHSMGSAPDVIWVHNTFLGRTFQAGALAPIEESFSQEDLKDLDNAIVRSASVNGHQFAIGQSYSIMGLIARGAFLKAAGIDPNGIKTWSNLRDAAKALTVKNDAGAAERWGICQNMALNKTDPGITFAYLLTGDNPPAFEANGKANWANSRGVEGMKVVSELIEAGVSPRDAVNWTNDEMYDQFAAGRCAIITGASVRIPNLQQATNDDDIVLIPYPSDTPGESSRQEANAWMTGVWSGSDKKAEAASFIAYMASPEADELWTTVGGTVPIRASTANAQKDFLNSPKFDYLRASMDYIRTSGWVPPFGADISGYRDDMNRAIQQVLLSGADPMAALKEAEAAYNGRHGY